MGLTKKILIGMGIGLLVGLFAGLIAQLGEGAARFVNVVLVNGLFDAGGQIFVNLLKLLVVPVVFASLTCGTFALGQNSNMGRVSVKTLGLYMFTTALAIILALLVASLLRPGVGIDLGTASNFVPREVPAIKDVLIGIFPGNPVRAMSQGNMLQIIFFAILLGLAIRRAGASGEVLARWFEQLNAVVMAMVRIIIQLAPYGVFCLVAKLFATMGVDILVQLAKYFVTVVIVLVLQTFVVYSLLLSRMGFVSPRIFFRKLVPVQLFAFSTASSSATLPVTLETVEKRLGVNPSVASFTVPLGATINMDGTAIMQGVATLFIAQAYNIEIGLAGFLTVILTAVLASIGTAGVPGVGLIMLTLVLQQVGLPVEGIALVIGVDRLLDMLRTATNVTGDAMVSTVVARSEGQLDVDIFHAAADQEGVESAQG